ncbi:helix-turn-helix domain-containing protein [Ruminococcus flavefaciens]|uniref:Helix-turn-helix domain-containing protein n=1 Tax=Ruminococcus flavefaciens TaxID=1265 RepID=A0A1M7MAA4_RUMFL|nr:AraC family transcriptional regulator [Ruminococcus flavefaciens]SHM87641.1 Helix-turn-helix domain-containing protein [Ruminococcus flavefaciens]
MKINRIQLNCRRESAFGGELGADPVLLFFRSPVMYMDGGKALHTSGCCAALLTSGYKSTFRPIKGKPMRYDIVSFRTSAADRQYIASMNLPQDTPIELEDNFAIVGTLRAMKSQSMHRGKHFSEFMELSMRLIFIALSDVADAPEPSPEESIPRYSELKKYRDLIYDDPMNMWSVEEICEDMQISRSYFHRIYLMAFGVTFRQDVIESRLVRAAELLKNTAMSVTAISETCGYDSESYFMRQFKKHKGCTPTEYRRRKENSEE